MNALLYLQKKHYDFAVNVEENDTIPTKHDKQKIKIKLYHLFINSKYSQVPSGHIFFICHQIVSRLTYLLSFMIEPKFLVL